MAFILLQKLHVLCHQKFDDMIHEKKFLSVKLKPDTLDLSKRWYIECYELTHMGQGKRRIQLYGDINKGKSVDERLDRANKIISRLQRQKEPEQKKSLLRIAIEHDRLNLRPKTFRTYETIVKSFENFIGGRNMQLVTKAIVNQYFDRLNDSGLKRTTIPKYRNILHCLYNKAIAYDLCTNNPVDKIPTMKRSTVSLQYFNDIQIRRLRDEISADNPQLWLAIQLMFYCFIRPGEQRLLRINDMNLDYGFIEIRGEISKNKKTEKVIIPDIFIPDLRRLAKFPYNYYVLSKNGHPGTEPIPSNLLNYQHSKYLKKLEITGRYAFYSWKHTGVVKCVQNGLNIRDIQNQLRHHSLDMVQEYLKNLGVLESIDLRLRYPHL